MVFVEVRFDPSIRHLSKNNQSVWSVDHNKALGLPGSKNNSSFIEHYMGPNLHSRDIPVSEGLGATVDLFLCRDGRETPLDLTKPVKDLNVLPFKSGRDYMYEAGTNSPPPQVGETSGCVRRTLPYRHFTAPEHLVIFSSFTFGRRKARSHTHTHILTDWLMVLIELPPIIFVVSGHRLPNPHAPCVSFCFYFTTPPPTHTRPAASQNVQQSHGFPLRRLRSRRRVKLSLHLFPSRVFLRQRRLRLFRRNRHPLRRLRGLHAQATVPRAASPVR